MSYKDAIYWLKHMLSLCGESLVPIKEALELAIYVLEKVDAESEMKADKGADDD